VDLEFSGPVFTWRGPSPHHFVAVPDAKSAALDDLRTAVTYGWGMVPVTVRIGATTWTTSLWPKDGGYLVPLKLAARRAEGIEVGDVVAVRLSVAV
jgi:hypothetical protein